MPNDTMRQERQFFRHPSDVPIELLAEPSKEEPTRALKNVSVGGLCCKSGARLDKGRRVKVRVPCVRPVFESEGVVAWCSEKSGDYEVGVQFLDPGDTFKLRMVEQICQIEHYRNEVLQTEGRALSGEEAAFEWISKYAADFPEV